MKSFKKTICLIMCIAILGSLSSKTAFAAQVTLTGSAGYPFCTVNVNVPITYDDGTKTITKVGKPKVFLNGLNLIYSVKYISKDVNYSKDKKTVYINVYYQLSSPMWNTTNTISLKYGNHGGGGGKF